MKLTLLGTGSSTGVPIIGCDCTVCQSTNPKNTRTRVSAIIEVEDTHLLIDSSPDLRQQALTHTISRIDAVLYTHAHADHTHGIDDLRCFNYIGGKVLPAYGTASTMQELQSRFNYAFTNPRDANWSKPCLTPHIVTPGEEFNVNKNSIIPLLHYHGKSEVIGYRIGNIAYSVDTNHIPESVMQQLEGLDIWVVDCLSMSPSPKHAHLELALEWIKRLKPKQAILTHMNHELEYDSLLAQLPPNVVPGYDGLSLTL